MRKPTLLERIANNFWGCTDCKTVHVPPREGRHGGFHDVQICVPCRTKELPDIDPETCDHEFDPDEGYTCLNCGKEGYEDMVCAAEAYSDSREDR